MEFDISQKLIDQSSNGKTNLINLNFITLTLESHKSKNFIFYRLIWFICVMVGAISTMVIIVSLWEKFQTNPTITGLDTDFHNWDIPYPSVTLCPNQPWNIERLNASVEKYFIHQIRLCINLIKIYILFIF